MWFQMIPCLSKKLLIAVLTITLLSGCSIPYYWQAARGQMRIVQGREPVAELLTRDDLSTGLRERLEVSQAALEFAHGEMLLPDNGSYTNYYDTGDLYIVWNVFAAPEFSLEPRTWCYLVVGCISYRGYFSEAKARSYSDKLAAKGADVYVSGVAAYSTLGRFRDPLLNTMLQMSEADFAGLLFHELAHQQLYIQDDSAFNEGFATAVEAEGQRRWQQARGVTVAARTAEFMTQKRQVMALIDGTRAKLEELYASEIDQEQKRARKQLLFAELKLEFIALSESWARDGLERRPYSGLFAMELNNASLGAVATYADYVPAFEQLLEQCAGELDCFYERAADLGDLDADTREARIAELVAAARKSP
ncbi:MAG: aminopeptidase [Gammaproteobacteria bacterium]|nr:aminopeptidase [Gammaproteobacteria bacterium]MDP6694678.1 aminopeptidase [Gammaproteobacteria bacterium]